MANWIVLSKDGAAMNERERKRERDGLSFNWTRGGRKNVEAENR